MFVDILNAAEMVEITHYVWEGFIITMWFYIFRSAYGCKWTAFLHFPLVVSHLKNKKRRDVDIAEMASWSEFI